jgi:uncharacterized protein
VTADDSTATAGTPDVRHDAARLRYEIWVDGARAGMASYQVQGDSIAFMHTLIGDEFGGRGLASILISAALDDVRAAGHSVLPFCPFVRAYIHKHREYTDLVPLDRRGEFGLD